MTESLSPQQFPKKRWIPDQHGHLIPWHMLKWHTKANEKGAKGLSRKIPSYEVEKWHEEHMKEHAAGNFEVDHEHEHFTPKKGK